VVAGAGGGRTGGEAGRMNRKAKRAAMQAQMLLCLEESVKREAAAWKREREASFPGALARQMSDTEAPPQAGASTAGRGLCTAAAGEGWGAAWGRGKQRVRQGLGGRADSVVGPEATVEDAQASLATLFVSCGTMGGDEEGTIQVLLEEASTGSGAAGGTPRSVPHWGCWGRPASGRAGVQGPGSGRSDGGVRGR